MSELSNLENELENVSNLVETNNSESEHVVPEEVPVVQEPVVQVETVVPVVQEPVPQVETIVEETVPQEIVVQEEVPVVQEPVVEVETVIPEEVVPQEIPVVPKEIPVVPEEVVPVVQEVPVPQEIPVIPEEIPVVQEVPSVVPEEEPVISEEEPVISEEEPVPEEPVVQEEKKSYYYNFFTFSNWKSTRQSDVKKETNNLDTLSDVSIHHKNTPVDDDNNEIPISEKAFIELIKLYLDKDEFKKKLSFELSTDVVNIIKYIIARTPNTFSDLEKAANDVIKDNKVDLKDIPQFIIIVQRIHQIIYEIRNDNVFKSDYKIRADFNSTILKFLLHVLVLEGKVKIDENSQADFLKNLDTLIDSCISLIIFSKTIKTKNCLQKLFT
jgi:hypothetical protein